jgi:hypothetical protein
MIVQTIRQAQRLGRCGFPVCTADGWTTIDQHVLCEQHYNMLLFLRWCADLGLVSWDDFRPPAESPP